MVYSELSGTSARVSGLKAQPKSSIVLPQADGPGEYYQQARPTLARAHPHHQPRIQHHQAIDPITPQIAPRQQTHTPKNAVTDILPFCTTEATLRQDQVIALSDVVGSVKELVLLALGAADNESGCADKMEGAVGPETTRNIVEFFAEEWEVE